MSQQNVANARRGYEAINRAYRSGDVDEFRPHLEAFFDPEVVFAPAGVLPESDAVQGWDELLRFTAEQMKAFKDGSSWIEPLEYLDAGDRLVVPYRFGGVARHTSIDVAFSFVHVFTMRDGRAVRVDVYETKAQALKAVGLEE
jgi:ketosteroid isomerase-like protein